MRQTSVEEDGKGGAGKKSGEKRKVLTVKRGDRGKGGTDSTDRKQCGYGSPEEHEKMVSGQSRHLRNVRRWLKGNQDSLVHFSLMAHKRLAAASSLPCSATSFSLQSL